MAGKPKTLSLSYTNLARKTLAEIWFWNAERHGASHADSYIQFLENEADRLETEHAKGKYVSGRSDYRYVVIKRASRGHGHVVVYTIGDETVSLLGFFHTSQDWQGKINREEL